MDRAPNTFQEVGFSPGKASLFKKKRGPFRLFFGVAISGALLSVSAYTAVQAGLSVQAWSDAQPVRISIAGFEALASAKWGVDRPLLMEMTPTQPLAAAPTPAPFQKRRAGVIRRTQNSFKKTSDLLLSLTRETHAQTIGSWLLASRKLPARLQSSPKTLITQTARNRSPEKEMGKPLQDRLTTHFAKSRPAERLVTEGPQSKSTLGPKSAEVVKESNPEVSPPRDTSEPSLGLVANQTPPLLTERVQPAAPISVQSTHRDVRFRRVSQETPGNAWIAMSEQFAPDVLFIQSNLALPRPLTSRQLSSQPGESMSNQGWVAGWIPEGLSAQLRGSSSVRYYSADGASVAASDPGEKLFVASRVPEGPTVVQLVSVDDQHTVSAAGIPVLAKKATQVDFRKLETLRVKGSVYDSQGSSPEGIAQAEVRVIGYSNHVTVTDSQGEFDLGEVQVPSGLNLFIEARTREGFVHRYSVSKNQAKRPLSLFYFSNQRVANWIKNLEGGVSANSGLVVASVKQERAAGARPVVKALLGDRSLNPETYWLTAKDSLLDPSLRPEETGEYVQWIGVEISSSGALAGLKNPKGRWTESRWVPTSPGVITVVNLEE